jgi:hypothetical protein
MTLHRDWLPRLSRAQWPMTAKQIRDAVGTGYPPDVVTAVKRLVPLVAVGRVRRETLYAKGAQ